VIVYHVSGHHALVNTMAMRDRGIPETVSDPAGGAFVRDEAGRLTGLCLDTATSLILPVELEIGCHGPNFHTLLPGQDSVALLDAASHEFLKVGLTTVCDPQVTRREMAAYREAHRRGRPPCPDRDDAVVGPPGRLRRDRNGRAVRRRHAPGRADEALLRWDVDWWDGMVLAAVR
jgi:predicted amidohydrolase YtcJ